VSTLADVLRAIVASRPRALTMIAALCVCMMLQAFAAPFAMLALSEERSRNGSINEVACSASWGAAFLRVENVGFGVWQIECIPLVQFGDEIEELERVAVLNAEKVELARRYAMIDAVPPRIRAATFGELRVGREQWRLLQRMDAVVTWDVGWPIASHSCQVIRWTDSTLADNVFGTGLGFSKGSLMESSLTTRPPCWFPMTISYLPVLCNVLAAWIALSIAFATWVVARTLCRRWKVQCTTCGYSMDGNMTDRCPECGSAA